jgi:hypothetical protein
VTAGVWSSGGAILIAVLPAVTFAQPSREAFVGSWRGTSMCTNRQAAPACNDEQVIYDISAPAGTPDVLVVKADKIVNGQREPMGEITFHPEPASARWVSEISTPRVHAMWHLSIKDGGMTGGMFLMPSRTAIRAIELRRVQGSE